MALPMNSLYSLTWGDYGTSLVSAIQLLRCHGDLVDCTLAAGGRSFPAHKIVLCAASPFLLDLLKNTPCKHPVVMLAGVNANDLEALLEFVYRGEVSVDHSQLPSLLQAAQCLNIQGLAPQPMTKDDYTTHSIQLQHMIPQHHDQDQLIATIATAPQQTVHAQVVEDLHQAGQLLQAQANAGQQTIVTDSKDLINQFLPARKRKPRVKKMQPAAQKITKVEGMDSIMGTPTQTLVQSGQSGQLENGTDGQLLTAPHIKSEMSKVETIVTVDPNMMPVTGANAGGELTVPMKGKRSKNPANPDKPRSRSQSEQPATCPICYAVIRQSRNLRRHLELRHFAKPGVKKEKKSKKTIASSVINTTNTSQNGAITTTGVPTMPQLQSVQSLHALQTVQVKKDPDAHTVVHTTQQQQQQQQTITVTSAQSGQGSQQQQQLQQVQVQVQQQQLNQQQHHQIIDQSGNLTTTVGGQNQQQQQQQGNGGQIVTQSENTDGTTSLSIAQVQTLQGHQILGPISQVILNDYNPHQQQQQQHPHQQQQQAQQTQQQPQHHQNQQTQLVHSNPNATQNQQTQQAL